LSTTIAILQGAHAAAAHFGGPHWLLNDDDAKTYALAVNNVARHYDIQAAQKTIDIVNLIGMACFIEGTRLLYSRNPAARQAQQPRPGAQIVPIFQFDPRSAFSPAAQPAATPAPGSMPPPDTLPEGQVH
jgi:hypothetical protein